MPTNKYGRVTLSMSDKWRFQRHIRELALGYAQALLNAPYCSPHSGQDPAVNLDQLQQTVKTLNEYNGCEQHLEGLAQRVLDTCPASARVSVIARIRDREGSESFETACKAAQHLYRAECDGHEAMQEEAVDQIMAACLNPTEAQAIIRMALPRDEVQPTLNALKTILAFRLQKRQADRRAEKLSVLHCGDGA